jgi:hypothetical protein
MVKEIDRMFRQIMEQNNVMMEMIESRLPEKKKRGRPKSEPIIEEKATDQPEIPSEEPITE